METMETSDKIIVVGLNGALQKRFVIQGGNLIPGSVHRASDLQTGVGGKGQDVAIALHCLQTSNVRLVQFLGAGPEGDTVYNLLGATLGLPEVEESTVRVAAPLRTCTSIVGSDTTTELVEPSGKIQPQEYQELLTMCEKYQASATGLCIMGSMPPGCSASTYADIYQRISTPTTLCVVDSVAGLDKLMQSLLSPMLLKINIHELQSLAGVSSDFTVGTSVAAFLTKYQPPSKLAAIAVTDGKNAAHLCCRLENDNVAIYRQDIPHLDSEGTTLFPIGAGDAVAAGTCAAWVALEQSPSAIPKSYLASLKDWEHSLPSDITNPSRSLLTAFAFGLACGSASKYLFGAWLRIVRQF
eukprot:Nitzschia sp. Nitz4//scaffold13_size275219//173261//174322//NITZ4_PFK//-1//CDS//3329536191//8186//frame0